MEAPTRASAQQPKRVTHPPKWWSGKGDKMEVGSLILSTSSLLIRNGEVAELRIEHSADSTHWKVSWKILHGTGEVTGWTRMSTGELEVAFRVTENVPAGMNDFPGHMSHASIQGGFIRFGNYLNIPHPATGSQGDPNISVFISDEIRGAVEKLLRSF